MSPRIYLILIVTLLLNSLPITYSQYELKDIEFSVDNGSLLNPLTGGFSTPQFSNIDLNRDGVQDLIVFDRDGDIIRTFIKNQEGEWIFKPEYVSIFPESIQSFLIVRDFNQDGVEDLFSYSHIPGISGVQVLKGKEENGQLSFELVTFENHRDIIEYRTSRGNFANAYVSNIDYPVIDDVDADGDLDVLSFGSAGSYISFYRNTAVENGYSLDSLNFEFADQCWGKIYEAETSQELSLSPDPNNCADALTSGEGSVTQRHAGSTLTLFDLNNDGLQDIVIGDLASSGMISVINGGDLDNAWGVEQNPNFPTDDKPLNLPVFLSGQFVNTDDDDELEFLASPNSRNAAKNLDFIWHYDNASANGGFEGTFLQEDFIIDQTLELTAYSIPAIADVNGNGRLDILVGTYGIQSETGIIEPRLFLFENISENGNLRYELTESDFLNMSTYDGSVNNSLAPTFGDMDNDGDEDLLIGDFSGKLFYFENIAGAGQPMRFAEEVYPYYDIDVGQFAIPDIIDVNEDGLPDLLIGERNGNSNGGGACGNINYFQNIGASNAPIFLEDESMSPNNPCYGEIFTREPNFFTGYSSPQLLKFQNVDLLITGSESRGVLLYEGSESVYTLIEESLGNIKEGNRTHPRLFDLDGDGILEVLVGNSRGGLAVFSSDIQTNGIRVGRTFAEASKNNLEIFPNPGQNWIHIKKQISSRDRVEVINQNGQIVKAVMGQNRISAQDLPAGMYMIKVIGASNEISFGKWIKL
jgi:hypothetical protein